MEEILPEPGSQTLLKTAELLPDHQVQVSLNSTSLGAPIDAGRNSLTELATFSQAVTVDRVSQSDFNQVVSDSNASPFVRVTVTVSLNGRELCSASWIRANY